jgi:hypothetical protein
LVTPGGLLVDLLDVLRVGALSHQLIEIGGQAFSPDTDLDSGDFRNLRRP